MTKEVKVELPRLPDGEMDRLGGFTEDQMRSYATAAVLAERDRLARRLELPADAIRLLGGEMSAGEMRTVKAVLSSLAAAIRKP